MHRSRIWWGPRALAGLVMLSCSGDRAEVNGGPPADASLSDAGARDASLSGLSDSGRAADAAPDALGLSDGGRDALDDASAVGDAAAESSTDAAGDAGDASDAAADGGDGDSDAGHCHGPPFLAGGMVNVARLISSPAVADLNGDGTPDLAVGFGIPHHPGGGIAVMLGRGDGSFGAANEYHTGTFVAEMAVGDVDNSGTKDLVFPEGRFDVLLGRSDGGFAPADFDGGIGGFTVGLADFDNDGKLDLAAATPGTPSTAGSLHVLRGAGDGTFRSASTYESNASPQSVSVADLNGDGLADIVLPEEAQGAMASSVTILIGNGDLTFRSAVKYPAGADPLSAAVADFNGDKVPDVVVANGGGDRAIYVLLGRGGGLLGAATVYRSRGAVGATRSIVAADFDGDGHLDVATGRNEGALTGGSLFYGNGDGSFGTVAPFDLSFRGRIFDIAVADFNRDGRPDLAFIPGGGAVAILLGTGCRP